MKYAITLSLVLLGAFPTAVSALPVTGAELLGGFMDSSQQQEPDSNLIQVESAANQPACRPCKRGERGCTHPGNANQAWCNSRCKSGRNDMHVCPRSHCTCAPAPCTEIPTAQPRYPVSDVPSNAPSVKPMEPPTPTPTSAPTEEPTAEPTDTPTFPPSDTTGKPTDTPTFPPSDTTGKPTDAPTFSPSETTAAPVAVTAAPTRVPTKSPVEPTATPIRVTSAPTEPTAAPIPLLTTAVFQMKVANLNPAQFEENKPKLVTEFATLSGADESRVDVSLGSTSVQAHKSMESQALLQVGSESTVSVSIKAATPGSNDKPATEAADVLSKEGKDKLSKVLQTAVPNAEVISTAVVQPSFTETQKSDSRSSTGFIAAGVTICVLVLGLAAALVMVPRILEKLAGEETAKGKLISAQHGSQ